MAQAAQVIALPIKKLSFKAEKINVKQFMGCFDRLRSEVFIGINLLKLSPPQMKKKMAKLRGADDLPDDIVAKMISDYEVCADDLVALAELMRSAAARLTIVDRGLI